MKYGPIIMPALFRILVIDDQICNDQECSNRTGRPSKDVQNAIKRYFEDVVKTNERDTNGNIEVETLFAKDPEEGVSLWQSQIFDLTLVDSDFSKSDTSRKNNCDKRNYLDLNLEFTGAYLYCFLREMLSKDRAREGCRIALWTGLGLGGNKEGRANDLLSILPSKQKDDFQRSWFIPKKERDITAWVHKVVESKRDGEIDVMSLNGCLEKMKADKDNPSPLFMPVFAKPEAEIGRIKSLYCIKTPEDFARLCDFDEYVYAGWLKAENGKVYFSDSWIEGGQLISPLLRSGSGNNACELDLDSFSLTLPNIRKPPYHGIIVPTPKSGQQAQTNIIAAATPLTGCSAVGRQYATDLMVKKIKALLDGPFGKVVLKTVYLDRLDQWTTLQWPTLQAQSHHRTRCLRSTAQPRTLWNTGITALESFTPAMMHEFLRAFADANPQKHQDVIVSLGSKFPQWNLNETIKKRNEERKGSDGRGTGEALKPYRNHILDFPNHIEELQADLELIWRTLFSEVFGNEPKKNIKEENQFPTVEINVRHYLRECIAFHLGGHEYLSPAKIDSDFTGCYRSLDLEFNCWLGVLDKVAKEFSKKLLLKLPFRGDLLHFIILIRDYVNKNKEQGTSIAGISLINAFKSGIPMPRMATTFSPAWYGSYDVESKNDKRWGMQMSGEELKASRYEIAGEVAKLHDNLELHASGGIMNSSDIADCINVLGFSSVQIGTWALMDLNLPDQSWTECSSAPPAIGLGRPMIRNCRGLCSPSCAVICPHGAFVQGKSGTSARIDLTRCVNCKLCASLCKGKGKFGVVIHNGIGEQYKREADNCVPSINPRIAFCLHELCNGCGKCSRTFYCDTFMDRRGFNLPPVMDSRNCTGCGLCAQTCPRGAIQLFAPRHVVVLIGTDANLTAWHRRLTAYEIPHLVYDAKDIMNQYSSCKHESSSNDAGDDSAEEKMFKHRLKTDSFFDKISKEYSDERNWDNAKTMLDKATPDSILRKWLFLAWSDPGQVLKDSPVICASTTDECCYFHTSLEKPDCKLKLNDMLNRSGMKELTKEVNKRLGNLREVR